MDFNKHDSGTQRQIDRRPQNVDELERFRVRPETSCRIAELSEHEAD
jgi:hypothetical protein